jgi:hypothetical protein
MVETLAYFMHSAGSDSRSIAIIHTRPGANGLVDRMLS